MEYWKFLRSKVGNARIIIPGVDAAIVYNGKILLVQTVESDNWFLPGGLQELGETINDTARREVREELGVDLTPASLLSVYSGPQWIRRYRSGDELQSLTFLLQMDVTRDITAEITTPEDEIREWQWFGLHALPDKMQDYARSMALDVVEYQGEVLLR